MSVSSSLLPIESQYDAFQSILPDQQESRSWIFQGCCWKIIVQSAQWKVLILIGLVFTSSVFVIRSTCVNISVTLVAALSTAADGLSLGPVCLPAAFQDYIKMGRFSHFSKSIFFLPIISPISKLLGSNFCQPTQPMSLASNFINCALNQSSTAQLEVNCETNG